MTLGPWKKRNTHPVRRPTLHGLALLEVLEARRSGQTYVKIADAKGKHPNTVSAIMRGIRMRNGKRVRLSTPKQISDVEVSD